MNVNIDKTHGFTLIELLVVMVIIGITISLTAPDMYNVLKRIQAKTEIAKIKTLVELSIERSFFASSTIEVSFKENNISINQITNTLTDNKKSIKEIESKLFSFEETKFLIHHGSWQGSSSVNLTASPNNGWQKIQLFNIE